MAESLPQMFSEQRYAVVRGLVTDPLLGFLWRHVLACDALGALRPSVGDVTTASGAYADTVMEHMLERVRPAIEAATGLQLHPTYSYMRLYETGARLAPHRDRPSCEISVSLNLGQEPEAAWPLWIAGPLERAAVELAPGDALLYRGIDCEHWREPFPGKRLAQVFLHFVDRDGPHAAHRYDGRDDLNLGIPLPL